MFLQVKHFFLDLNIYIGFNFVCLNSATTFTWSQLFHNFVTITRKGKLCTCEIRHEYSGGMIFPYCRLGTVNSLALVLFWNIWRTCSQGCKELRKPKAKDWNSCTCMKIIRTQEEGAILTYILSHDIFDLINFLPNFSNLV